MIDIESLGLTAGSVILSIGAADFTDEIHSTFYRSISIQSCVDAGLSIDPDTLEWWMAQDDDAQECLVGGVSLYDALVDFNCWYIADEVWANSPAMDCVLLEHAYKCVDLEPPWTYDERRDMRTVTRLSDYDVLDFPEQDTPHHALDDAVWQAEVTMELI